MSTDNTASMSQTKTSPEVTKPVHTILLDTSPILLNTPSISTLLATSHALVTTQSVLNEIRGEEARNRLDTLYKPFLTVRSPKPESVKFVKEFARKTGDGGVLSGTDFEVLALAYDLECERNGGDWRLRSVPGQRRLNGSPPTGKEIDTAAAGQTEVERDGEGDEQEKSVEEQLAETSLEDRVSSGDVSVPVESGSEAIPRSSQEAQSDAPIKLEQSKMTDAASEPAENIDAIIAEEDSSESEDGWITPSNIKKHQAKDDAVSDSTKTENRVLQVATMTGDFAMQNVLLRMNLNLLSTKTCKRIAHIKQMIFRCHACFATTKDMSKQFCPRCGGPTLTRVSCTTNDKGEVKLHLKANYQWNNRGNVFSIPKPVSGSANQKWQGPHQGGGKGGWGSDLVLAEDQKEYSRAVSKSKKMKNKDLMDDDVLPSIITGDRDRGGGRTKVGAGRNVNARKR